ncbi:chorismate-binding protein [Phaeovibrio sulfidiphilus]|uniref:Anthranilate synthase component 1 n=1 Tax=Phaeovibrio sulfidiphilus TaxID=1220600 RepID=A0A8J7CDP3_9PROT|nr:chorismate-binding protein [Phaeovibrio sulfidiphilus]MBE1237953.1 chorismate-binding protein [Phaeovibrio sulfidiphilus]
MSATFPEFNDAFVHTYNSGKPQLLRTRVPADLETPVSAFLKLAEGQRWSFLFDSIEGGALLGRYSFIGLKPDLVWKACGTEAFVNRRPRIDPEAFEPDGEAQASLRRHLKDSALDIPEDLPPMAALMAGYLGWGAARFTDPGTPDTKPDPLGVPDGIFMRPTLIAIFDNVSQRLSLVTPVRPQKDIPAARAYELAQERLSDAVADFQRSIPLQREYARSSMPAPEPVPVTPRETFLETVREAIKHIKAGEITQIVPSQRFSLPFRLPPFLLYRSLRRTNPSPFMFYMDFGDFHLVGSSPEILVRLRGDEVTIRPIAGTRPRGATPEEDRALARDLLDDPKERAEHIMLLDLARDDVGSIAEPGSVNVTAEGTMFVEYYSHVMHIVSNVTGRLRKGLDALDALFAGFPAGTVSGAPRARAMELIDQMEPVRRSFYAGAVGYFSAGGSMDTCITLRTCLIKDGVLHVQSGAGVVADSVPEKEHEECVNKARAMIRAAEEAVSLAGR